MCCVTRYLLTFYRDRVFQHHQETSHEVMEKISKIANLFLQMQRTLEQCVSPCVPESVRPNPKQLLLCCPE